MKAKQSLDQASIKRHNTERLLSALERFQPVSRTRLAQLTDMSSASVTRIVGALSALGLVREVSLTEGAGRGRKAVNLHTTPDGIYTLGCHIDPRSLRLCLLDFSNECRASCELALSPEDLRPERLASLARSQLPRLLPEARSPIRCAGVSLSGRVDGESGRVVRSAAFDWTDVDLCAPFRAALGMPVHIENDVKACLTWESMRRGLLDGRQDAAYLYLGRAGIGFANTVGGRLVRGLSNSAGEIEDVALARDERLSEHLMEVSLVRRAQAIAPSVRDIGDIVAAHRMGLPWARVLMDDFVSHLNIVLGLIRALLDPHCIILGGDIPDALRHVPELLPQGDYHFGERYEDSCALGAAVIAMRTALHALIERAMGAEGA